MKKTINNPHDKFFRKMMAKPEVLREFLELNLEKPLLKAINLNDIAIMPKAFISDLGKDLVADLICKVKISDRDSYMVFLVEHQSQPERLMPFRVLQYTCEIINRHLADNKTKTIPLVVPLVVYNGKSKYRYSTDLKDLVDAPKTLVDQYFLKPFQLIDLSQIDDKILKSKLWAGVVSLALKHKHTAKLADMVTLIQMVSEIDELGETRFSLIVLQYIVQTYGFAGSEKLLAAVKDKVPEKFQEKMMTIAEAWVAEGRVEGRAEGLIEGEANKQREIALRMLALGLDLEIIEQATQLSKTTLQEFKQQL